jgi:inorganic triphosphatase YgiF
MGTEVELKLALASEATTRLKRHALLKGHKPTRRRLLSLYFDTPDQALSRRGAALRLRRVGYHWVQTLKAEAESIGALTRRPEWEVQVAGNRPDLSVMPEEARALLVGIDEARLEPIFITEFTRTAWHVERASGALELALDQGEVRAGSLTEPISEVEFELKAGTGAHIFDVVGDLLSDLPFTLEPRSKAERGYQLAGITQATPARAEKTGLTKGTDAGVAWRAMLASALGQLIANVPGVLYGVDTEYLHQARIAARRLRTLLSLAHTLDLDVSLWETDLRWLMAELSPARDWDVLLTETLPGVVEPFRDCARLAALIDALSGQRAQANQRARAALVSNRFVRLILEIEENLVESTVLDRPIEDWAAAVLDRRQRRLKELGKNLVKLDAPGLHALRIATKRLRYSAEAFATLREKKARGYINALSRLQDTLGVANDLVVARRLIGEWREGPHAYAAGLIEGRLASVPPERAPRLTDAYRDFAKLKPFWK